MRRILLAAVIVEIVLAIDLSGQTIADIARRERNRQSQTRSRAIYTNGLAITATASTSSITGATSTAAPAGSLQTRPEAAAPTPLGSDEKYWRNAFQKAREESARADARVQTLELKIRDLNTQLLRQSDMYNRENRIGAEITATQTELDAARRETAQARQKITDLEDALRRSGGLPGWAR